jgi:hypothetical protein
LNPPSSDSFLLATADETEVPVEAAALGPKRKLRISDKRHTNQLATKRTAVIPVPESNIDIDGYDMMFGLPKLDELRASMKDAIGKSLSYLRFLAGRLAILA